MKTASLLPFRPRLIVVALLCLAAMGLALGAAPTVGMNGELKDVFLPGPELRAKPDPAGKNPVALRVTAVRPHGNAGFRYDLVYSAFAAGSYDLAKWLERTDGQPAADLPAVPVEVAAVLPAGPPKPLPQIGSRLPALGGYRGLVWVLGIFWAVGFLAILFWRRKRSVAADEAAAAANVPLVDRLRPLLESAAKGGLDAESRARLDRLVLGFWRERLGLGEKPVVDAIRQLRADPTAGELLRRVEEWLHRPAPAASADPGPEIAALLQPYLSVRPT